MSVLAIILFILLNIRIFFSTQDTSIGFLFLRLTLYTSTLLKKLNITTVLSFSSNWFYVSYPWEQLLIKKKSTELWFVYFKYVNSKKWIYLCNWQPDQEKELYKNLSLFMLSSRHRLCLQPTWVTCILTFNNTVGFQFWPLYKCTPL